MSAAMFQRFMEKAPVTVMVRSTLERVLSPAALDAIFANSAVRQVESELLFSSVVELLALVVWRFDDLTFIPFDKLSTFFAEHLM